ncbi:MAG: hypothetical protein OXF06_08710 [Bacteroidetes bacterium]|nr:hypothetical protein [Bacteroidota bacterium]
MAINSERTVNTVLAHCLRSRLPNWDVGAEQTNVLVEKKRQPDLVVSHVGDSLLFLRPNSPPLQPLKQIPSNVLDRSSVALVNQ